MNYPQGFRIFLSRYGASEVVIAEVYHALHDSAFDPWTFTNDDDPMGTYYPRTIDEGLTESEASIALADGTLTTESEFIRECEAISRAMKVRKSKFRVLPVVIGASRTDGLPFSHWKRFEKLPDAIAHIKTELSNHFKL